jgi:hypothetical protein
MYSQGKLQLCLKALHVRNEFKYVHSHGAVLFLCIMHDATLSDIFFHRVTRGAWFVPFHSKIVGGPPPLDTPHHGTQWLR